MLLDDIAGFTPERGGILTTMKMTPPPTVAKTRTTGAVRCRILPANAAVPAEVHQRLITELAAAGLELAEGPGRF